MQSMQIKPLLALAANQLQNDEAALEARALLQHTLDVNHAWLISHADDVISEEHYQTFQALLQRRINGEPIAYILGVREFYGLALKTTSDTLIPRPDTETLVDAVLERTLQQKNTTILDLGTGSGAIALAVAKNRPQSAVTAVDASEGALGVAQENATNLNIANVSFVLSNWFDVLENKTFDLIVSNPPYIEEDDPHLSQGDLRFEPRTALASGADGLDDIRQIISNAKAHLNDSGYLLFEHGYNQASVVSTLLKTAGFSAITTVQDLGGNDRVTLGQLLTR